MIEKMNQEEDPEVTEALEAAGEDLVTTQRPKGKAQARHELNPGQLAEVKNKEEELAVVKEEADEEEEEKIEEKELKEEKEEKEVKEVKEVNAEAVEED